MKFRFEAQVPIPETRFVFFIEGEFRMCQTQMSTSVRFRDEGAVQTPGSVKGNQVHVAWLVRDVHNAMARWCVADWVRRG